MKRDKELELYAMVLENRGALTNTEQTALLKAQLALSMFDRAMMAFSADQIGNPGVLAQGGISSHA